MNALKPHYKWKEAFPMPNEISQPAETSLADYLRKRSTGAALGNIDSSDLKPPRLKVLAGQSPEVTDGLVGAIPGNFWITILNANLGPSVVGTPILLRKSYQLWAPRSPGMEQKGPLATASDGIHWDVPNQTFEVRFPMNPKVYKWFTKNTVFENGLNKFGSSQPENPKSKPAATLTYDVLWLIDLPNGNKQLCVFTSARTGITPTQNFVSTTKAIGLDHFYQRYRITVLKKTGPTGDPYFTYDYAYLGEVGTAGEADFTAGLYAQYVRTGFVTDMAEEAADIKTAQRTEGGPRDYGSPIGDDEIPFS
jgi:hypothetical protein